MVDDKRVDQHIRNTIYGAELNRSIDWAKWKELCEITDGI